MAGQNGVGRPPGQARRGVPVRVAKQADGAEALTAEQAGGPPDGQSLDEALDAASDLAFRQLGDYLAETRFEALATKVDLDKFELALRAIDGRRKARGETRGTMAEFYRQFFGEGGEGGA